MSCLKNEHKGTEDLINSLSNGNPGPQKRRKYVQNDERLKNIWERLKPNALNQISSFEFLDKAAFCINRLLTHEIMCLSLRNVEMSFIFN